MKKPIFYEHESNKNDFAFIDDKGRDGTAYRVCRTFEKPKIFAILTNAKAHLEAQGYRRNPNIIHVG